MAGVSLPDRFRSLDTTVSPKAYFTLTAPKILLTS